MKFNDMLWVHRLLLISISFKFAGLSSSSITNITETTQLNQTKRNILDAEYVDSRDAFTSTDTVSNEKTKRSIDINLDDDLGTDDIMNAAISKNSEDGDAEPESNTVKHSSLECQEHTMECPAVNHNLDIDFSIGNEIPITMEKSNEIPTNPTMHEVTFEGAASDNVMIQNKIPVEMEHVSKLAASASLPNVIIDKEPTANIMTKNEPPVSMEHDNELTAKVSSPAEINDGTNSAENNHATESEANTTREKRDSKRAEINDYDFVSPEISAMIRSRGDNEVNGDFDPNSSDVDIMASLYEQNTPSLDTHKVLHLMDYPVSKEQISILTAKASSPKKTVHIENNYNTLKKELIAEIEMMKNVSYHNEHKHKHKRNKHNEVTSKYEQVTQRLPPIANREKSELSANSTSPKDDIMQSYSHKKQNEKTSFKFDQVMQPQSPILNDRESTLSTKDDIMQTYSYKKQNENMFSKHDQANLPQSSIAHGEKDQTNVNSVSPKDDIMQTNSHKKHSGNSFSKHDQVIQPLKNRKDNDASANSLSPKDDIMQTNSHKKSSQNKNEITQKRSHKTHEKHAPTQHNEMNQRVPPIANHKKSELHARSTSPKDEVKQKHSHKKKNKHTASKHDQMSQRLPPLANHRRSELNAKSSSPELKRAKGSKNYRRTKVDSTNGELKSIFTEMRSAKHKLTRSDIRKLAKTAVMLAALKSRGHFGPPQKRHFISKPKHNKNTKKRKAPKSKKKAKKSHTTTRKVDKSENMITVGSDKSISEMSFNTKDVSNQPEFKINHNADKGEEINVVNSAKHEKVSKQLDITVEQPTIGKTEFSEDTTRKSKNVEVSDEAMGKNSAIDEVIRTTTTVPTTSTKSSHDDTTSDIGSPSTTTPGPTTVSSTRSVHPTTPVTTTIDGATDLSKELALKVITDGNILQKDGNLNQKDGNLIQKKSEVTRPDDDIEKIIADYDTNDLFTMIDSGNTDKKNIVPSKEISDSMASLKSVLSKVSPNKVPGNFLPDIPAGLRMIAWKKLLEKKKTQLAEYESVVGASEAAVTGDKPVTVNIDLESQKGSSEDATAYSKIGTEEKDSFARKSVDQAEQIKDLESEENSNFLTANHDDSSHFETARHVHYLKKHISGARSLRKLIAKTLVGHCKSTGKRILAAFIAMDKALERAQAIATVIGGKFNVDPSKIENLVSDKEDQVVETFLRDIFTKL